MKPIIDSLQAALLDQTNDLPRDLFLIRGIWEFGMCCQPWESERTFTESGCLVATCGLGASFRGSDDFTPIDKSVLNKDARFLEVKDQAFRVALLDACYSALPHESQEEFVLDNDTVRKANSRAKIISDEVMSIAERFSLQNPKVLMIGYVKAITDRMQQQGMRVIASDLDKNLIGKVLGKHDLIHDGSCNRNLISECDIVLMTGLTITSSTIDGILEAARANSKPVVVFAQTGSNFAHAYLGFGITTAVAENFPWYSIPGRSTIRVYRQIAGGCQ